MLRRLLRHFQSVALALAFHCGLFAAPRILDATRYHLGVAGLPEWQEFENVALHGRELHLTFLADAEEITGESTLLIRQRDVKATWQVTLNGHQIGTLETLTQPLIRALSIPPGSLRSGENKLTISRTPSRILDNVVVGEIALETRARENVFTAATLEVTVTAADSNAALPCRLTLVDSESALVPLHAASGQKLATRTGVIYTGNGRARFGIAAGDYVLHASRGFEYSVATERVTIAAGETKTIALQLHREVPTVGWIAADTHIHTLTHSKHGDASLEDRMYTIAGEGIELAVATDHNHHTDFTEPAAHAGVSQHFRSVVGNEVTTKAGHFNAFPIRTTDALPNAELTDWPHLLAHIRSVTGAQVITLNHPRDMHANFTPFGAENFDATTGKIFLAPEFECDAIEVITSAAMQSDPMLLFRDWFALLNHGYRVAAIAASDTHHVSEFILGQARTYVANTAVSPSSIDIDEVCASFHAGRLLVSFGLLAHINVNRRFTVGDLATDLGNELDVVVEVLGPSWTAVDRIELFANGEKVRETRIPAPLGRDPDISSEMNPSSPQDGSATPKARVAWKLPSPKHDIYLVVIATGPGITAPYWETPKPYQTTSRIFDSRVIGATNPVWIDGDGDGKFTAPRAQAAALIGRFGNDATALAATLRNYDEAVRIQLADLSQKNSDAK